MTDDEAFKKLGEFLSKAEWGNESYAVATELRDYFKTIIDVDTNIKGYLEMFTRAIILSPIINGHQFSIVIYNQGPIEEEKESL